MPKSKSVTSIRRHLPLSQLTGVAMESEARIHSRLLSIYRLDRDEHWEDRSTSISDRSRDMERSGSINEVVSRVRRARKANRQIPRLFPTFAGRQRASASSIWVRLPGRSNRAFGRNRLPYVWISAASTTQGRKLAGLAVATVSVADTALMMSSASAAESAGTE